MRTSTATLLLAALAAGALPACTSKGTSGAPGDLAMAPPPDLGPLVVEKSRYETDLEAVARVRPPGSDAWKVVQDLCFDRFTSLGYETTRSAYATGVNVIGVKRGTSEPGKQVIVSAHYDHIKGCPGADDNGTGVAGLLEAARVLAAAPHDRTLVVACWDEEERGLIGSKAYAKAAKARGDQIELVLNFEMIGFKSDQPNSQKLPVGLDRLFPKQAANIMANQMRGDFIAAIFDDRPAGQAATAKMASVAKEVGLPIELLPVPVDLRNESLLADLRRSDHAAFWLESYPALFVTDTANFRNPYYHCAAGPDSIEHLDAEFAVRVVKVVVAGAEEMLAKR